MLNFLKGRKTYIIGIIILAVNSAVMMGAITQATADKILAVLAALGLMAVRAAIGKVAEK